MPVTIPPSSPSKKNLKEIIFCRPSFFSAQQIFIIQANGYDPSHNGFRNACLNFTAIEIFYRQQYSGKSLSLQSRKMSFSKRIVWILMPALCLGGISPPQEYTLSEIIQLGLQYNPHLLARQSELAAQEKAYQAARLLVNPKLVLTTGQGKTYEKLLTRRTRSLVLEQEIENPFKRQARLQAVAAGWRASQAAYDYFKLELTSLLKEHGYHLLLIDQQLEIAQKKLESITKMSSLIQAKADLGEVKPLDALKLQVEAQQALNEKQSIDYQMEMAKMELNSLLNNRLPPAFKIKGTLAYSPLDQREDELIQLAFQQNPLLQEKKAAVEQVQNELTAKRWARFPDLTLSAFSSREIGGQKQGIGLSFSLPLWNFKSREINSLQYNLAKEQQELAALQLEISLKVRLQLRRLQLVAKSIQLFQENILKMAQESLHLSSVSYQEGEIALIDYLDAQRTYYSVLNDYFEQLYQWQLEKIALEKIIGEELQ